MQPDAGLAQFLIEHLVGWAAQLVAALVSLLYVLQQQKAKAEKDAYTKEITALQSALAQTISKDDFNAHERREEKDRDERRDAEGSIRRQVTALDVKMDSKFSTLDAKIEGKLNTIINNMLQVAQQAQQQPHNRRVGDQ